VKRRSAPRGQNFLVNAGAARAIVDAARLEPGDRVLEVGPGRGALTRLLLERCARVVAVEIEAALAGELDAALGGERLAVENADATRLDWERVHARAGSSAEAGRLHLVANLPYDVATPILLGWIARSHDDPRLGRAVVMVQREVAERLCARPRGRDFGSLAALVRCTHDVERLFDLGPGSFRPRPAVHSRVVRLERRERPLLPAGAWSAHAAFVRRAFSQRRKQLAAVLAREGPLGREQWRAVLREIGRSEAARAEELSPEELVALAAREASSR